MLVQDELNTKEQAIHQNNLIMQWEDYSLVLGDTLNLLVSTVYTEV